MKKIKDVFDANAKSLFDFFCSPPGIGFYIPAYQRQYDWGDEHIIRLFEDISKGLYQLYRSEDSITFLGTIITINDSDSISVENNEHLPSQVLVVIDGQQRLSTLLLCFAVFYEEIHKMTKSKDLPHWDWIQARAIQTKSDLKTTFEIDMKTPPNSILKFYPKLIRAHEDVWSCEKNKRKASSPISRYLNDFILHINDPDKSDKTFEFALPHEDDASRKTYEKLTENISKIKELMNNFINQNNEAFDHIEDKTLFKPTIQKILFGNISDRLAAQAKGDEEFKKVFRLLVLVKYFLSQVAITHVSAADDSYAFDLFEALNTTGEPLTALQTFKPKVVEAEKPHYQNSESDQFLKHVESFLEKYKKSDARQIAANRLLIPFALSENGTKLTKKLRDQRAYLRDEYSGLKNIESKRAFVQHLSNTSRFLSEIWIAKNIRQSSLQLSTSDEEFTNLLLQILKEGKHEITICLLERYYGAVIEAKDREQKRKASSEFLEVLKATVAFYGIYRAANESTNGIDEIYRDLMIIGNPNTKLPAINRQEIFYKLPTSEKVKKAFLNILKVDSEFTDKSVWVKKAKTIAIYKKAYTVAKLILITAGHDSIADKANPGLIKYGRAGCLNLLTPNIWDDSSTIEHIAPQTKTSEWSSEIYESDATIHTIGNLTLLRGNENSTLSNSSWEKKVLMYRLLTEVDKTKFNKLLKDIKKIDPKFTVKSEDILKNSKLLPHTTALTSLESPWTKAQIEKRSERLLELAWDKLHEWLKK